MLEVTTSIKKLLKMSARKKVVQGGTSCYPLVAMQGGNIQRAKHTR
jgi:hypothetical protein